MARAASETSALLANDNVTTLERSLSAEYGTNGETGSKIIEPELTTSWQLESKLLLSYSAPLMLTYMLQYTINSLVLVYVAGRLGTDELAASSLALMVVNITGIFLYEGLATTLDTLTSQAYGAGKSDLVGLHVQRMIALMAVTTLPIAVIWICSGWILALVIPEKKVAHMAGDFVRLYLLGAPGYAAFEAGKRFVQAQGNFTASLVVLLICAPLNVLANWLLVFKLGLGFNGAALAVVIVYDLMPILLVAYIYFVVPSTLQCWPGLNLRGAFKNWGPMIHLSIPGVLMVFCEWLAFDLLSFCSSYLSTQHLAAQSVLVTVCMVMYHIPFPISIAASTRFGNLIGFGALKAARKAFRTHYAIIAGIGIMDLIILTSLRHVIPRIFTEDQEVRRIISSVVPIVAGVQFFDATTALASALLRGLGRQRIGGWANLAVYYVFAVPLSIVLTFGPPKLELFGLWTGPCCGLAIITFILTGYMCWTKWENAIEEARMREE